MALPRKRRLSSTKQETFTEPLPVEEPTAWARCLSCLRQQWRATNGPRRYCSTFRDRTGRNRWPASSLIAPAISMERLLEAARAVKERCSNSWLLQRLEEHGRNRCSTVSNSARMVAIQWLGWFSIRRVRSMALLKWQATFAVMMAAAAV